MLKWVLVIFNQETDEVEVRGSWDSQGEGHQAARAWSQGLISENDTTSYRLAVVAITPMVYFSPALEVQSI